MSALDSYSPRQSAGLGAAEEVGGYPLYALYHLLRLLGALNLCFQRSDDSFDNGRKRHRHSNCCNHFISDNQPCEPHGLYSFGNVL